MDTFSEAPVKKGSFFRMTIGALAVILLVVVSFFAGKASNVVCSQSVLGAETSGSWARRLALLFNIEQPSQNPKNFELIPTPLPTIPAITMGPTRILLATPTSIPILLPTPTTSGDPGMYYGGTNRDSDTVTPVPTQPAATKSPENTETGGNRKEKPTPQPTPQYRAEWDRNGPSPTPTFAPVPDKGFNDETDGKRKPEGTTPTPIPTRTPFSPDQIKQIIDLSGMVLEKPEIMTNVEKKGYTINGSMKDKLFGFLPVSYPVVIKVSETTGNIETVTVPWWRKLFGNPLAGIVSKIRCGDGICSPKEDYTTCPSDCAPVCGNGICELGEGADSCPFDCQVILPTAEPTLSQ